MVRVLTRKDSVYAVGVPIYVIHEVVRGLQEVCEKHVRLAPLNWAVAFQGRFRLEVVVHPPSVLAEPIAIGQVGYNIVPAHPASGRAEVSNHAGQRLPC